MNLSNIKENDIIKNYKIMCKVLDENQKTGNSRIAQEKEWQRYFDYEKIKQKYLITKIYDEPLEKIDERINGNSSIYIENFELLLLDYLSRQKGYITTLTLNKIFLLFGMVNHKYFNMTNESLKSYNEYFTDFEINHFYQRTRKKLREITYSALNNLQKRRLIKYKNITMIEVVDTEKNIKTIQEASKIEENIIKDVEREVLEQMNIYNITLVFLKFKHKEFYERVNSILQERYNINYYYTDIEILFTQKYILEALKETETLIQKRMINNKIIDTLNKQAENNQIKENSKYFGEPNPMKKNMFNDIYIFAQKQLIDLLIKLQ